MENKQEKIIEMFNDIAPTYDKANRVMSFGVDISWRKWACEMTLGKLQSDKLNIVDVACGTGDMMDIWQKSADKMGLKIDSLTGVDPSVGMLEVAKKKFPDFKFITASATDTTLAKDSAQILSISYGIRNVVARMDALKEFNKVLQMGGYLVVLEFTKPQKSGVVSKVRDFYISKILPKIGGAISKNKEAYEYLPNSIGNFLDSKSFADELASTGFETEVIKGFSFDVCTLFIAKKIKEL